MIYCKIRKVLKIIKKANVVHYNLFLVAIVIIKLHEKFMSSKC